MLSLTLAALIGATAATLAALAVEAASRRWRRHDPAFWHVVWAGYLLVAPVVLVVALGPRVVVEPLSLIYAGVVATLLAQLLAGWWRVRRIARLAYPVAPAYAARLAGAAARETSRPPRVVPPRIRLHPRLQTAVTVGWRRPVVLLPAVWAAWPPDRLDVVVRHELAHVGRGDYATSLAAAAVAAVFWFVPGVWLAARRMRWFAELAADASAAGVVGRALYARQLLEAAGGAVRHGSGPFRLVVGAPGAGPRLRFGAVDLQRRVAALLDER
jgi:hypothetical protein